jgi:hypothetical protein
MKSKKTPDSSHSVGTAAGAAGGAVAGGALGSALGPAGTVIGGAVGAAAGALAGRELAKAIDPAAEDRYWRENYTKRDYVEPHRPYSDYRPAYRYGWESRARLGARPFDDVETDLDNGWSKARGESRLTWGQARTAARDAWHRVERAVPGDADGDGF